VHVNPHGVGYRRDSIIRPIIRLAALSCTDVHYTAAACLFIMFRCRDVDRSTVVRLHRAFGKSRVGRNHVKRFVKLILNENYRKKVR